MKTYDDAPKVKPMFRLENLEVDEEVAIKLEAFFAQCLVRLDDAQMLNRIPGLDSQDVYELGLAIRNCCSLAEGNEPTIDLGIGRLLRDVGKIGVRGVKLDRDFYNLTPERERKIREILQWRYDSYSRTAFTCMTLLYGIDGNAVHTYSECVKDDALRGYSVRELRKLIDGELRILATYLVPMYARETFQTADEIPLCYLQLKARNCKILAREGCETVADLIVKTPEDLRQIYGIGETLLEDIERGLKWCNFSLA